MHEHDLTLDQMLDDPIVRLLMARDGVAEADLRALATRFRPDRGTVPARSGRVGLERRSFDPDLRV